MGFSLVKKALFLLINCILNIIFLLCGQGFIFVAFALSFANIILIPLCFKKNSSLMKAGLTAMLMFLFSSIQILYGYIYCDDGGIAFMWLFTIILTVIPMSICTIVHIIIYPWEKENKEKEKQ